MDFEFGEVETIEKVPEPFRGLYAEGAGTYKIAPEFKGAAEAVIGLNRALKAARAEAKANRPIDLSPLQEFGGSPEEIKSSVQSRIQELQNQLASGDKAKLNLDKIREELAAGHSREIAAQKARTDALQNQLYSLLVENAATTATVDARGVPELLLPFIKNQVRVLEEDGEFRVFVTDAQGDRRYSGITGQPLTIKELVLEMKANEKYGRLFESEAPQGGGMIPGSGTRAIAKQQAPKSANDKILFGLQKRLRSS